MLCKKPHVKAGLSYGCGQCLPCLINRRRLWAHRILLESYKHHESCFVTLTYSEENYPPGGTLVPEHLTLWLKRFRKAIRPLPVRYFAVGEYGTQTQRAHYHAALFGVGMQFQNAIAQTWKLGYVHVGGLTPDSAAYISGYVTKKMTAHEDQRLGGRHPEFARMSLRPGIGAAAMSDVAAQLTDREGAKLLSLAGDVPGTLQHGRKQQPLGRYLKARLRDELGFENLGEQTKSLETRKTEMRALRKDQPYLSPDAPVGIDWEKIHQVFKRHKIWTKKESI